MKRHALTILTSLLLLAGSASLAFADDNSNCQVDADCGANLVCVESQSPCAVAPCAEGEECPKTECTPTVYKSCQLAPPASCETTANCDSGLVCMIRTTESCSSGGSPPPCASEDGADCDSGSTESTECETSTKGYCVPPYIARCTDDASCGAAGFTCESASDSCECATVGSPDGQDGGETKPEDCGCPEPDETNRRCELAVLPCTTTADCSGDFVCHQRPAQSADITCATNSETGETHCTTDEPAPGDSSGEGRCAPADYIHWMNGGQGSTGGTKHETAVPDGENNTGNTPGAGAPNNDASQNNDNGSTDDDGCHIASLNTGKTSTTALLLAGAAAFFTFGRRRKR